MALVNLMCGLPYLGDSYSAKIGMFRRRDHEAMHATKTVFFLSVNVLMVWHVGLLGCMAHNRVS